MAAFPTSSAMKRHRQGAHSGSNGTAREARFGSHSQRQRPPYANAMRTSAPGVQFWPPFQRQRPPNSNAMKTLAQ